MQAEEAAVKCGMNEVHIVYGVKDAKHYAKEIMSKLREGIGDVYTVFAKGKLSLMLCDQVMEMISSWVTIISIDVERANFITGREKSITIVFKRNLVFKKHFDR